MRYARPCPPSDSTHAYKAVMMVMEYDTAATKDKASPRYPLAVGVIMENEKDMRRRYAVSIGKNKVWYYRSMRTAMADNNISFINKDAK